MKKVKEKILKDVNRYGLNYETAREVCFNEYIDLHDYWKPHNMGEITGYYWQEIGARRRC